MKKEAGSERQGAHPDVPAEPELKKLGPEFPSWRSG